MSSSPATPRRAPPGPLCACLVLAALSACGKKEPPPAPPPPPKKARPATVESGEPAVVEVKHVLIAFQGSRQSTATRSREDAEKLAYEILGRAREGEEFDGLMRDFSDDAYSKGGKAYTLTNHGVDSEGEESARSEMARGFGDVSFRLKVGEIGLALYDPATTPHGFHIIKRVK